MDPRSLPKLITSLLLGLLAFAFSGWARADPPGRVARLAYVSGSSSFSPGGEKDWVRAVVNRPLVSGDRLWVDAGARAELQLGAAAIRIAGGTSITLLNLDDRVAQVQLAQGTLNIRVRRLDSGQVFEVDTPNLAYVIRRPGSYRIEVDADGTATTVIARSGLAEVYGEGRAFITRERQAYRFFDSGLSDYETFALAAPDAFDRFSNERDRRWDTSASRRYVSPELIGYDDLDQYGTWRQVPDYGPVWTPTRVAADWAPYRDGHWAWVEPWGWTWVDDAPWGFAPSHYGRWAHLDSGWAWVPGPVAARPVYAPALVVFVGGSNLRISGSSGGNGAVGWFPLAPREVYRPSYTASREYFNSVNTSNTAIDRTRVTNLYNTTNVTNVTYVNQQVPGAVVAMLAVAFAQSRPVAKESVRVTRDMAVSAPATVVAPIAPVHASVVGAAPPSSRPPEAAQARRVVAQAAPPPPPVSFAVKQSALAANAGKPLDTAAVAALKPAAPAAAPTVKVVTAAQPVALPARPASASPPSGPAPSAQVPSAAQGTSAAEQPTRASSGRARPPSASAPTSAAAPASAAARTPAAVPAPAASPAPTASRAIESPVGRPAPARERQAAEAARSLPPAATTPSPRESGKPRAEEERATRAPTAVTKSPEPPGKPTSVDAAPAAASPIAPAAPKAAAPAINAPQPGEAPRVREPRQPREAPGEAPPRSAAPARQAEPQRSAPPPAAVPAPPPPAAAARVAPPAAPAPAARAPVTPAPAPATPAPATPAARSAPPAAPATPPAAESRTRRAAPDEGRAPARREAASEAKKAASDARNVDERRK
jgi:hypothetical protein